MTKILDLSDCVVDDPQYWSLTFPKSGEVHLTGARQETRANVSSFCDGAGRHYGNPWLSVPITCEPFLVQATNEAMAVSRLLRRVEWIQNFEVYITSDNNKTIDQLQSLVKQLQSDKILDRYSIEFLRSKNNIQIISGREAHSLVYFIKSLNNIGLWPIGGQEPLFDVSNDEQINVHPGWKPLSYIPQKITPPDNIEKTAWNWFDSKYVVVRDGIIIALIRDALDFQGGGEIKDTDPFQAAQLWFGLFELTPKDLITQAEAAKLVGLSGAAINNAIRDNRLIGYRQDNIKYKPGSNLVSRVDILRLWMEQII